MLFPVRSSFAGRFSSLLLVLCSILFALSVPAQDTKPKKRKKFGWSLKEKQKTDKKTKSKENAGRTSLPSPDAENDAIKVKTDLILTDVLVLNAKNERADGLKMSDFIVVEDGEEQTVEVFHQSSDQISASGRHFLFVLDHSNSNVGHMRQSIDAAQSFVEKLGPNDRMALVTDDVELLADFTNDKKLLNKQLEWVYSDFNKLVGRWGGYGLTYTALHTGLTELFDNPQIRPIVVFQSSSGSDLIYLRGGRHDGSNSPFAREYGYYNFTFAELLDKIIEKRATVFTIINGRRFVGLSEREQIENLVLMQRDYQYEWTPIRLDRIVPMSEAKDALFVRRIMFDALEVQESIVKLAEISGGTTRFLQNPDDAKEIYADVFEESGKRYVIGYYSTSVLPAGKLRKVTFAIRNHPEYVVRARNSYFPR